MANASRHSLSMIVEATYGTTPATTPQFDAVRHLSTTLGLTKDALVAQELRADRQISDHQYGVRQVGGDIVAELTYGGTVDTILEAVLGGTWTTNVLKAGTTRRSYSILRRFLDLSAGHYHLFKGCEFNTLSLQNAANDRVQMTAGVIGQDLAIASAAPAGATFPAAATTGQMTGILGAVSEGGSPLGIVTEVSFSLENGLEIRPVIGSNKTLEPSIGRSNCTGQVVVYFEDATQLTKFVDETSSSLDFTCTDAAGNDLKFEFPNIKYSGGDLPAQGQGAITLTMPFQALYDSGDATQIIVTRTPA